MAMEKNTRAELIAALVTDSYSGFKDGDENILEGASDARLEELRAASESRRGAATAHARLEGEQRQTSARLKVAEERIKALEAPMTEDDFMNRAPEKIKAVLLAQKAEDDAYRASLISQLKDLGNHSEEALKSKSTDDLKTLAAYARVEVPSFRGRGVAVDRNAEQRATYAPPDPYKAGLAALRGQQKN